MRAGKLTFGVQMSLLAALATLSTAAPAGASVVIGSDLRAEPTAALNTHRTYANLTLASPTPAGVVAPQSGVITAWAVRLLQPSDPGNTLQLQVIAGDTGGAKGIVHQAPKFNGITTYADRVPIAAGARVGFTAATTTGVIYLTIARINVVGSNATFWDPPLGIGEVRAGTSDPGVEYLMQATIEADADGDDFGDETQDGCVGTSGTRGGCPPPVTPTPDPVPTPTVAPDTQIASGPTKTKKPKATFTFTSAAAGATFECALDELGFNPCTSPATLKRLARGKHSFRVRAISAEGLVDRSPAEQAFKVKPKPKPK